MKFSNETLNVLKSFTAINKSILLNAGNTIKTITPEKTLIAIAEVPAAMPSQACVYDLSRFLSILSLYNEPDVEFGDKYFVISEGKRRTKYVYADISMIHTPPEKEITLPSEDVSFEMSTDPLAQLLNAAAIYQLPDLSAVGENGVVKLVVRDKKNDTSNDYAVVVGETEAEFSFNFKVENIKVLPGTYEVSVSQKLLSRFTSKNHDLTYYIALEPDSTFG